MLMRPKPCKMAILAYFFKGQGFIIFESSAQQQPLSLKQLIKCTSYIELQYY